MSSALHLWLLAQVAVCSVWRFVDWCGVVTFGGTCSPEALALALACSLSAGGFTTTGVAASGAGWGY